MRRAEGHKEHGERDAREQSWAGCAWPLPEGYELFDFACASALLLSREKAGPRPAGSVSR